MATDKTDTTDTKLTTESKSISFDIYGILAQSRQNHGVDTDDFNVYRNYLTKQLSILRKRLKLQCLDTQNSKSQQNTNAQQNKIKRDIAKKIKSGKYKPKIDPNWNRKYKRYDNKPKDITWKNREIRVSDLSKNPQSLLISLYLCERAWAYSVSIYEEYDEDNKRKYHHSNSRLRKAIAYALSLFNTLKALLSTDTCTVATSTLCQSFGYLSWVRSMYYLQTEQIEASYEEYLKCIQISPNKSGIACLETNMNEKLAYFKENIDKQRRISIDTAVTQFIQDFKVNELGIQQIEKKEDETEETKDETSVYVELDKHKVMVPAIGNVRQLMKELYEKIDALRAKCEGKMSSFKKETLLTSIVLTIDDALRLIQTEAKRRESGSDVFVIEKYLLFEKLRFSVCRQWFWMRNKKGGNTDEMLYQLAVLSEVQIENLDELSSICDVSDFEGFVTQTDILRNLFEISRKYYIAKIHFVSFENYLNAYHLFEHHVIGQSNAFIDKLEDKWDNTMDHAYSHKMYDFTPWIEIEKAKEMMQRISIDSQRLSMTAKAKHVLSRENPIRIQLQKKGDEVELKLADLKPKLYPLLMKPIMIDIAWNYVDYQVVLDLDKPQAQKKEPKQQSSSWFGSIFGGK
eukprot:83319_1